MQAAILCIMLLAATAHAGFFPTFHHSAMPAFHHPAALRLFGPFDQFLAQPVFPSSRLSSSWLNDALDEFASELHAAALDLRETRPSCCSIPDVRKHDGSIQFTLPLEGYKPEQIALEVDQDKLRLRYNGEPALERILQLPAIVENRSDVSAVVSEKGCLQITLPPPKPAKPAEWHPVPISLAQELRFPQAVHLGFCCDQSKMCPIVGVRYTRPSQDGKDSYDLHEKAFRKLSLADQAGFEAVHKPVPANQAAVRHAAAMRAAGSPPTDKAPEAVTSEADVELAASETAEQQMRDKLAELEKMFASTKDQLEEAVQERKVAKSATASNQPARTLEQTVAKEAEEGSVDPSLTFILATKPTAPKPPSSAPKPASATLWRALADQALASNQHQEDAPEKEGPTQLQTADSSKLESESVSIEKVLQRADLNGDGEISRQEFVQAMLEKQYQQ